MASLANACLITDTQHVKLNSLRLRSSSSHHSINNPKQSLKLKPFSKNSINISHFSRNNSNNNNNNMLNKSSYYSLETSSLLLHKVKAQNSVDGLNGDLEAPLLEEFSWSSVILPFVFPALGGLLFGYDIGATSGATISLQSAELSGTTWFNLSAIQLGLVVSGSLYGALFGSILVYPIADFIGRKRELIIAASLYAIGGLMTAFAPSLGVLLAGRVLYGLGIGWAMHGAPLYIAETCPSQIRGTLISLKELFIVLGILLGYFVGSFQIDVVGGWRYMFGLSVPVAVLMGLGMLSLPSSPRWLLLRGVQGKGSLKQFKQDAIAALSKLRGRPAGDKVSEAQIEETLVSLKSAYQDQESDGSFLEVFQGPNLKAFLIGGGLVLFQQITGQPSVLYYAGSILQTAGFSAAADATRVSVLIGVFKATSLLPADTQAYETSSHHYSFNSSQEGSRTIPCAVWLKFMIRFLVLKNRTLNPVLIRDTKVVKFWGQFVCLY